MKLKRLGERAMKAAVELNNVAELRAELSVAENDAAKALVRLAEELEEAAKPRSRKKK